MTETPKDEEAVREAFRSAFEAVLPHTTRRMGAYFVYNRSGIVVEGQLGEGAPEQFDRWKRNAHTKVRVCLERGGGTIATSFEFVDPEADPPVYGGGDLYREVAGSTSGFSPEEDEVTTLVALFKLGDIEREVAYRLMARSNNGQVDLFDACVEG